MNLILHLIRPDDLLNLRIETENLRLDTSTQSMPVLVVDDHSHPGLLTVIFPPQHIAETALFESAPPSMYPQDDPQRHDPDYARLTDPTPLPEPGSAYYRARMADPSRLVFEVPPGHRLNYTTEGLLDWAGLVPVLHPLAAIKPDASVAEQAAAPPISAPTTRQTVLELPYRLLISPNADAAWVHRKTAHTHRGRTELWHTRLSLTGEHGKPVELDAEHTAPLRAIWSLDDVAHQDSRTDTPGLGRTALSADDRRQLVILTSAFHGYKEAPPRFTQGLMQQLHIKKRGGIVKGWRLPQAYVPLPFQARQLMLSPLGGWLKSRGNWNPPEKEHAERPPFDLSANPEFFQALLTASPLLPERKADQKPPSLIENNWLLKLFPPTQPSPSSKSLDLSEWVHIATQGRDHYVRVVYEGELWPFRNRAALVKVTERKFKETPQGRVIAGLVQRLFIVVREPEKILNRLDNPLQKIRLTTLVTPDLAEPEYFLPKAPGSFWVQLGSKSDKQKFQFHAIGTDQAGRQTDFILPMVFASISDVDNSMSTIVQNYNKMPDREAGFFGRKIAYTELRDNSENPLMATEQMRFDVPANGASPKLGNAQVRISPLEDLLGSRSPIDIHYLVGFENKGYDDPANLTGVFAELAAPLSSKFRADQAGGIATPNLNIQALSNQLGPVAGTIANAMQDHFDPSSYFPANGAKLFGSFDLFDLLPIGGLSGPGGQAPSIKTERQANALVTQLHWNPQISDGALKDLTVAALKFEKDKDGKVISILMMDTRIERPFDTKLETQSEFKGSLTNFTVIILKSVEIHFDKFAFASHNGSKPNVSVNLKTDHPIKFTGDLEFVEELRKAIPPALFGKGASLDVTGAGIRAGFAIALPPLEIGVFALKDVSLGAALTLPFLDGKPLFDFNVSERANPFQLRISFFAGGGFFHLQMDTAGMRQLEASLEFGAAFGLNLALASGEVHAMAGIYYGITRDTSNHELCTLTGFLRVGGRLSVIGIIRISVEFNLSFTYQVQTDKVYGRATVTVCVDVLFISVSVSLTVERAFGGANDPVFLETFTTPTRWQEYAAAFA